MVAAQALAANIPAKMHSLKRDFGDRRVRVFNGLREFGPAGSNPQNASAGCFGTRNADSRSSLEHGGSGRFRFRDARNRDAGFEPGWVST